MTKLIKNGEKVTYGYVKNLVLPPKRFEPDDPTRDPLRGRAWYPKLQIRKWQLPFLSQAARAIEQGWTQVFACDTFGVDTRELRDYVRFHAPWPPVSKTEQAIVDDAYYVYQKDGGERPFHSYLEDSARSFGLNPRRVREIFELNPSYLPTGYTKPS